MCCKKKKIIWALFALLCGLTAVTLGQIELRNAANAAAFDLDNQRVFPLRSIEGRAVVLLFVSVDCPISNQYAPEIQRLEEVFGPKGVKFWLVYPNTDEKAETVREHTREFGYKIGALRDSNHALVKISHVGVTPEAAVLLPNGELIYHGAIDDRYVDFGVHRQQPTRRTLEEILTSLTQGTALKPSSTTAVGCPISF